jgi:MFS family permease
MSRSYWQNWAATLLFFAAFYALLVPLPHYLTSLSMPDWQLGLVLGAFGIASLIGRPLLGYTTDRWGSRPNVLIGAALFMLGAFTIPFVHDPLTIFVLRVLQAGGYVAFTTASTSLVAELAPAAQRGQALAIFGVAANIAMSFTPAVIDISLGWIGTVGAFFIAGLMALVAALLAWGVPSSQASPSIVFDWRTVLVIPRDLRLPMLAAALLGLGFGAFLQFMPLLVERRGLSSAGLIYSFYALGIILTRIIASRWLNGEYLAQVITIGFVASALGLVLLALGTHTLWYIIGAMLVASGGGLLHPALMAHNIALLPAARGRAIATFYLGMDLGIGIGSWLLGFILEYAGLTSMYLVAALGVTCGLLLVMPIARQSSFHPAQKGIS